MRQGGLWKGIVSSCGAQWVGYACLNGVRPLTVAVPHEIYELDVILGMLRPCVCAEVSRESGGRQSLDSREHAPSIAWTVSAQLSAIRPICSTACQISAGLTRNGFQ